MMHVKLHFIWATTFLLSLFQAVTVAGQCSTSTPIKLAHTVGSQSYGCTDVSVTSDGGVWAGMGGPCTYGPYIVGVIIPGSYSFSFSIPVQGVMINVSSIENNPGLSVHDEMFFEKNGTFYPLTSPGTYDNCYPQAAVVTPQGTLMSPIGLGASTKDIFIPGPIYSLKVAIDTVGNNTASAVNFSLYICCYDCDTDAGTINANNIEVCGETAVVPPSSQVVLDADDILQYILFSDYTSPKTSILATSSTPSFNFDPATMDFGTPYYIAAIAGNVLNGNVDSSDPCWDISNFIQVVWWPEPTVVLTSDADCLQPGECYDINLSFIGNPPFHLTGQVLSSGNVVITFDSTYNLTSSVMQICLPPSTPDGPITLEALSLSDAHCACE